MSERGQKLARYVDENAALKREVARLREQLASPVVEHFAAIADVVDGDASDPAGVVFRVRELDRRANALSFRFEVLRGRLETVRRALEGETFEPKSNGAEHGR